MSTPWDAMFMPLSGPVTQGFKMMENLFSPQYDYDYQINFAGDRKLEQQVVSHIASYGAQLGGVIPLVLELSRSSAQVQKDPELKRKHDQLEKIYSEVLAVKERQESRSVEELETDLRRLKKEDPKRYQQLQDDLAGES